MSQVGEPEDSDKYHQCHERNRYEAKSDNGRVATSRFEWIGRARKKKGVPSDVLLVMAVIVISGNGKANGCHDAHDQVIRLGFCPETYGDNNFDWEHKNTLPPTQDADGGEIDVLIGEGAYSSDSGKEGNSL